MAKLDLKNNSAFLIEVQSNKLHAKAISLIKSNKQKNIVYVTCSKTAKSILDELAKKKIKYGNILFIDVITQTFQKVNKNDDQCIFLNSPNALTDLSIALTGLLKQDIDLIVIDAITHFAVYNKPKTLEKFVASIINKTRQSEKKVILLAAKNSEYDGLIKKVETFVDTSL